jgi:hypothetical protein
MKVRGGHSGESKGVITVGPGRPGSRSLGPDLADLTSSPCSTCGGGQKHHHRTRAPCHQPSREPRRPGPGPAPSTAIWSSLPRHVLQREVRGRPPPPEPHGFFLVAPTGVSNREGRRRVAEPVKDFLFFFQRTKAEHLISYPKF